MLLNDLKNNGYVVIKGSFRKKDFIGLNIISKKLHKLYLENKNYSFLDNYYFKNRPDQGVLYDLYQRYPEFRFLLSNSFVNNLISEYYQHKPFVLYENSLVYKPPGKSNEVPAHQDFLSRPNDGDRLIIWIPFDNVRKNNGAMKVLPGSHKSGYRDFIKLKGETHHSRINITNKEMTEFIDVEINAGDVLIFNPKLIHKSEKIDQSKNFRFAYRYAVQEASGYEIPRGSPIILSETKIDYFKEKIPHGYHLSESRLKTAKKNIRKLKEQFVKLFIDLIK